MNKPDWKDCNCTADNCERRAIAKSLCDTHYRRFRKSGNPNITINSMHGMQKSAEYRIWSHIKGRCENPNDKNYKDYGARGIYLCERWHSFSLFFEDMGERPSEKSQIDREDNNDGYRPGNCRWVDSATNNQNRRSTKLTQVSVDHIRKSEKSDLELSFSYGVTQSHIARVRSGKRWKINLSAGIEALPSC